MYNPEPKKMSTINKIILSISGILLAVILIASAVGLAQQKSPSSVPSLPTKIIKSELTPTSVLVQPSATSTLSNNSTNSSWDMYSSMRTDRIGWSVKVLGHNSQCINDLRANHRACDGNSLVIKATTPLLIMNNGNVFAQLKVGEVVEIKFDENSTYNFFGLAERNHKFMSAWNASGYIWSETHLILLLPRNGENDEFIDLVDGITYQLTADPKFFDFEVSTPTLGQLKCDGSCQFTP